jgi:hypothetical protein
MFNEKKYLGSLGIHPGIVNDRGVKLYTQQLETGDFNADGIIDIMINTLTGEGEPENPSFIYFMIGQPDGTYKDGTSELFSGAPPTVFYAPRVFVGDLNGDKTPDIYVAEYGDHRLWEGSGGQDQVWLSDGVGRLTVSSVSTVNNRAHGVSAGDIEGDGDLDIVVNTLGGPTVGKGTNLILINDGNGNFLNTQTFLPVEYRDTVWPPTYTWNLVADLNNDSKADLVFGEWQQENKSVVLLAGTTGSYESSQPLVLPKSPIDPEAVQYIKDFDLNNDGLKDLIISTTNNGGSGSYYTTGYLQFLINIGDGSFVDETSNRYPSQEAGADSSWWKFIRLADFNRDGHQDIQLSGAGYGAGQGGAVNKVLLNDGNGVFSDYFSVNFAFSGDQNEIFGWPDATSMADINNDGYDDLLVLENDYSNQSVNLVGVLNNFAPEASLGSAFNNRFSGLENNQNFNGGDGIDTVSYDIASSSVSINIGSSKSELNSSEGGFFFDVLISVERLQFTDTEVALDIEGANSAGGIYRTYKAAFNRTPEKTGFGYWIDRADNGASAVEMAEEFVWSAEFQTLYGVTTNDNYLVGNDIEAVVDLFYQNVLGRTPDPVGLAYYTSTIEDQNKTGGQVLAEIADSAENRANLLPTIENGMSYDLWVG